uniref:Uncharacterized protein n=1 Tax=Manihot esculenta TaxID=3983 RepID=A0A2C9U4N3_MANES
MLINSSSSSNSQDISPTQQTIFLTPATPPPHPMEMSTVHPFTFLNRRRSASFSLAPYVNSSYTPDCNISFIFL